MPRLLILSTTFYPDPGVGAVRMTQWARALPDFGWETHVLCKHYGYEATPEQLAEAVHRDVKVHYLGNRRAASSNGASPTHQGASPWRIKAGRSIERLLIPDASIITWRGLTSEAIAAATRINPDVVLSTSPHHSIHSLGRRLARATNSKWVADFRDPYLIDPRCQPTSWRKPLWALHKRYEQAIYRDADLTIHAIPLHGRWARRAYPNRRGPAEVLPNGTPSDLSELARHAQSEPRDDRLSLRSVGHLGPEAPAAIYRAFLKLAEEGIELEFRHAGKPPASVADLPAESAERMTFLGPVSHPEAIGLVAGADLLVAFLSEARSRYMGVSSKLFEFLGTGAPVLAINPTRTDRQLLRRTPGCEVLCRPDEKQLVDALRKMVREARAPDRASLGAIFAEKYDRRRQAEQLAGWLKRMLD